MRAINLIKVPKLGMSFKKNPPPQYHLLSKIDSVRWNVSDLILPCFSSSENFELKLQPHINADKGGGLVSKLNPSWSKRDPGIFSFSEFSVHMLYKSGNFVSDLIQVREIYFCFLEFFALIHSRSLISVLTKAGLKKSKCYETYFGKIFLTLMHVSATWKKIFSN